MKKDFTAIILGGGEGVGFSLVTPPNPTPPQLGVHHM